MAAPLPFDTALITGASSGIGRALAVALARPGAALHLSGRNAARLEETTETVRARGGAAYPRVIDVRDAAGMAGWIAEACSASGRLDLVVANAGISAGTGDNRPESMDQVRAILAVNVDGVLNTALPALERMRAQAPGPDGWRGRIATVSSVAAFVAAPGAPAHCASKALVDRWTVATAATARLEGVLMTSICPGYVRTRMTARNRFPMPGLMDAELAAARILRGVAAGRRRVAFPWWVALVARTLGALPPALVARLLMTQPGKD